MQSNLSEEQLIEHGMGLALLAELLAQAPAVLSETGNRTFKELNAKANQLIRALRAKGIKAGDAVALLAPNSPEFVETLFACLRGGLRVTPINWHQPSATIAYIVDNCEARVLIASARFSDAAALALQQASKLTVKLAFGGSLAGFEDYSNTLAYESAENITDPQMGISMLYTSGTTGRPKGVYRHSQPAEPPLKSRLIETGAYTPNQDLSLVTGPLYHAGPLALNLLMPLSMGVGSVLMDKWDAEQALRLIHEHKVTHTHMVPTMIQRLLALPEVVKKKYDISSLRHLVHGAAPCPVHVKQEAMAWFGPIIYEYYAATEGGGIFCEPEQWLRKPGTVGLPSEGVEVTVMDENGQKVAAGERGIIYFKAPDVGRFEYFKDTEKTDSTYQGDYYTMGDIGYVDEEGFVFLTGRSAELVICGGVNIYPAQIDEVLSRHPAIADVATIGVPASELGEEIKAVVELNPGFAPDKTMEQSILDFAYQHLTGFMRPRTVTFIESVPRSAAGKILRRELREPYWQDQ